MAVTVVLSEIQRATLARVCDTFVPAILDVPDDPHGFWARSASDLGIPEAVEQMLAAQPEEQVAGLRQLLDALAAQGFDDAPQEAREQILHALADDSPETLAGVSALQGLSLLLFYALPDPTTGRNPNWEAIGYPGPQAPPPDVPKPIQPVVPVGEELVLEADVCVIGSGAGGGTAAGTLAEQGKRVCVLEMGGYYNEADFNQLELWAYEHLYLRGGLPQTVDGAVIMLAGSNLGGGTTVNWTNCLRTTPAVREEWEREHGLEGLTGPDYDRHLDAVFARIGVCDSASDWNGPHLRLKEGCEKLGYEFRRITRNADPTTYDAQVAGLMGYGDQSGSKLGTLKTYLQDAYDRGAQIVARCRAERVLVEGGRAAGVEGIYVDEDGREARVTVRAPQVVVAAGSLETPAVLLRSGIGGPAVGRHLRIHPSTALSGIYGDAQRSWWGAPQTGLTDHFADLEDGYGFLVECPHTSPGVGASATPWQTGRQHKELMSQGPNTANFILLVRDRGEGRVTIDRDGNAVWHYALSDERDVRLFRRALVELCRLHEAAGAEQVVTLARKLTTWRRAEGDFEGFLRRVEALPLAPREYPVFSAHQMGTARMGRDPATSVANPWGELHDTPGVWIGDCSAFPTASGTNPMITGMALARRTAEAVAAA